MNELEKAYFSSALEHIELAISQLSNAIESLDQRNTVKAFNLSSEFNGTVSRLSADKEHLKMVSKYWEY